MPVAAALGAVGGFLGTTAGAITLGAGAGLASAVIGSNAAKSAAQTQAAAAQQATNTQEAMYNQTRADLSPFVGQGVQAGTALSKLLGTDANATPAQTAPQVGDPNISAWAAANPDVKIYYDQTPEAQQAFPNFLDFAKSISVQQADRRSAVPVYTANDVQNWTPTPSSQELALENLPGYQFARDQGVQSVNRSLGSMGKTGAQIKGISRFVTGLADQTYGNQVNRLQAATNTGESAAAQTGSTGASYANGISNTLVGAGTAQAAGTVGAANAVTNGLSSIPGYLLTNSILKGSGGGSASSGGIYDVLGGTTASNPSGVI